jgi:hypothetical protein
MALEILQRDDLSIYVLAGVPKSFRKKLQKLVSDEVRAGQEGGVLPLEDELVEWVVARLKEDKRRNHERTSGSAALWRAYRALGAARYHLKDHDLEPHVRAVRDEVEHLWQRVSPLFQAQLRAEQGAEQALEANGETATAGLIFPEAPVKGVDPAW